MRVYFAHPVSDYDTEFERRAIAFLADKCGDIGEVENPNQPHHQEGYARFGMAYFTDVVLPACDVCVYWPFPGGMIGAGVAMEVEYFLERGMTVYKLVLCDPPWAEYSRLERVAALTPEEWRSANQILTRDETRGATKVLKSLGGGR